LPAVARGTGAESITRRKAAGVEGRYPCRAVPVAEESVLNHPPPPALVRPPEVTLARLARRRRPRTESPAGELQHPPVKRRHEQGAVAPLRERAYEVPSPAVRRRDPPPLVVLADCQAAQRAHPHAPATIEVQVDDAPARQRRRVRRVE